MLKVNLKVLVPLVVSIPRFYSFWNASVRIFIQKLQEGQGPKTYLLFIKLPKPPDSSLLKSVSTLRELNELHFGLLNGP